MRRYFFSIVVTIFAILSQSGFTFGQTDNPTRYAILASQEFMDDGLVDLLTAKLTGMDDLELVERADVDKVTEELNLSELLGSQKIGKRLELGKILNAQRLIVLRNNELTNQAVFSIVDTEIGVLLHQLSFEKSDNLAQGIVEMIDKIHRDFIEGPKAIVCVPHFFYKSLFKEYEKSQQSYADLLSLALLGEPGIAVVVMEEYEIIRRESDFFGEGKLQDRVVAVLVQGEFAVNKANADQEEQIDISVSLTNSSTATSVQFHREGRTSEQVVTFLLEDVFSDILSMIDNDREKAASVSPLELEKIFAETAERFHFWGSIESARKHREALLLINPDDTWQRVAWIAETLRRPVSKNNDEYLNNQSTSELLNEVLPDAERLLKNKKLTLPQGLLLIKLLNQREIRLMKVLSPNISLDNIPEVHRRLMIPPESYHNSAIVLTPYLGELALPDKESDWELPLHGRLSEKKSETEYDYSKSLEDFFKVNDLLFSRLAMGNVSGFFGDDSEKTYWKTLFQLQSELPASFVFNVYNLDFITHNFFYEVRAFGAPRKSWESYLDMLKSSPRERFSLYADYLDVFERIHVPYRDSMTQVEKTALHLERLRKIQKQLESINLFSETKTGIQASQLDFLKTNIHLRSLLLEEELEKMSAEKRNRETPKRDLFNPVDVQPFAKEIFKSNLTASPILDWPYSALYHGHPATNLSGWNYCDETQGIYTINEHLIPHTKKADIVWTNYCVYLYEKNAHDGFEYQPLFVVPVLRSRMKSKHERVQHPADVFPSGNASMKAEFSATGSGGVVAVYEEQILKVSSDGKNIWIAWTGGIECISENGNILAHFDATYGLPPYLWETNRAGNSSPFPIDIRASERYFQIFHNNTAVSSMGSVNCADEFISSTRKILSPSPQQCTLTVFPTDQGECIALGATGSPPRTWIAKLSYDESTGEQSSTLIHTAIRTLDLADYHRPEILHAPEQKDISFHVPWICRFDSPDFPGKRLLLIGRSHPARISQTNGYYPFFIANVPLIIDLDNNTVQTLGEKIPALKNFVGYSQVESVFGFLVAVEQGLLDIWQRRPNGSYQKTELRETFKIPNAADPYLHRQTHHLLRDGNTIHSPGQIWYRFDFGAQDLHIDRMSDVDFFPNMFQHCDFSVSANHGIWSFAPEFNSAFQFKFEEMTQKTVSPYYGTVPWDKLEQHQNAIERIRANGGFVERRTSSFGEIVSDNQYLVGLPVHSNEMWAAIPSTWTQNGHDFQILQDVCMLNRLYLFETVLTEEDMRQIGRMKDLKNIAFVHTNVDDNLLKFFFDEILKQKKDFDNDNTSSMALYLATDDENLLNAESLAVIPVKIHVSPLALNGPGFTKEHVQEFLKRLPEEIMDKMTNDDSIFLYDGTRRYRMKGPVSTTVKQ